MAVFRTLLTITMALVFCTQAHADPKKVEAKVAKDFSAIATALRKTYPEIPVDAVSKTDMDGIFEVLSDGHVFYYHQQSGSVITGEILRGTRNITAARRDEITAIMVRALPLEKAVKTGAGKSIVIEFSDPDCPYCRQADAFLSKRDDITWYVFMFPLSMHKDAEKKSLKILCSANMSAEYRGAMEGKLDTAFSLPAGCEAKAAPILKESIAWGKKLGVMGTPALWVNGKRVNGADIATIQSLLDVAQKEKAGN